MICRSKEVLYLSNIIFKAILDTDGTYIDCFAFPVRNSEYPEDIDCDGCGIEDECSGSLGFIVFKNDQYHMKKIGTVNGTV